MVRHTLSDLPRKSYCVETWTNVICLFPSQCIMTHGACVGRGLLKTSVNLLSKRKPNKLRQSKHSKLSRQKHTPHAEMQRKPSPLIPSATDPSITSYSSSSSVPASPSSSTPSSSSFTSLLSGHLQEFKRSRRLKHVQTRVRYIGTVDGAGVSHSINPSQATCDEIGAHGNMDACSLQQASQLWTWYGKLALSRVKAKVKSNTSKSLECTLATGRKTNGTLQQHHQSRLQAFAQRIGINEYVRPKVGDALCTLPALMCPQWSRTVLCDYNPNFHFAAVVMCTEEGNTLTQSHNPSDRGYIYVTLENWAVNDADAINDGWGFCVWSTAARDINDSYHARLTRGGGYGNISFSLKVVETDSCSNIGAIHCIKSQCGKDTCNIRG